MILHDILTRDGSQISEMPLGYNTLSSSPIFQ